MGMSVCDQNGQWTDFGSPFPVNGYTTPLVQEFKERLSYGFGEAEMTQIIFSGVCIYYGDVIIRPRHIRLRSDDAPNLVELHFVLSGSSMLYNDITQRSYSFQSHQHNMFYTPAFEGRGEFTPGSGYKFLEVHFSIPRFLELAGDATDRVRRFADKVVLAQPVELGEAHRPITPEIHRCLLDIMECKYTGGLKLLFLQAKCVELLVLQARQFDGAEPRKSVLHSQYDRDRIAFARDHLLENMLQPPSLPALAKTAGINEFKLKQGFREVYGASIYNYLKEHKMTMAKSFLAEGMAIKDIADLLGYSSVPHFTQAFHKHFGVPPGRSRG